MIVPYVRNSPATKIARAPTKARHEKRTAVRRTGRRFLAWRFIESLANASTPQSARLTPGIGRGAAIP